MLKAKLGANLAPLLMVVSGLAMYVGAAIAVGLFTQFPPFVVAWMRVAAAGIIMAVVLRPRPAAWWGTAGRVAIFYGLSTAAMNMAFYEAIARMPLGLTVAIEFLGPIAVAAFSSGTPRDWTALVAAGVGVALIAGIQLGGSPLGLAFSFLSAALWALYIVAGARLSGAASPAHAMAVGFTWSGLLLLPLVMLTLPPLASRLGEATGGLWPQTSGDVDVLTTVGLALGLGILAAVIPYGLDQVILSLVPAGVFAVLLAILPLTACFVGLGFLHQTLSVGELVGIGLVVIAVVLKTPRAADSG